MAAPTITTNQDYDLNEFNGGNEVLPITDFIDSTATPTVSVVSRQSNVTMAAKAAALDSSEQAVDTFRKVSGELDNGSTDTVDDMLTKLGDKSYRQSGMVLANMLSDPNLSDEEKKSALDNYDNLKMQNYSINKSIMTESLIADSGNENLEQEYVRVSLADVVNDVNTSKRQMQGLLNQQVATANTDTAKGLKDIFEYLVPTTESAVFANLVKGVSPDDAPSFAKMIAFAGDSKAMIRDSILKLKPEERLEFASKLVDHINNNSATLLSDTNDFARVQQLRVALEDGFYGDTEQFIDNAMSVLDATLVFGSVGRLAKGTAIGRITGAALDASRESIMRSARRMSVHTNVSPTSVSQLYKDTNPAKAANLHEAMAADLTGEVADAAYGTTRADALANDIMPEIANEDGFIRSKLGGPEAKYEVAKAGDPELMDFHRTTGATEYTQAERVQMRTKVVHDFENAFVLTPRKEMNQVASVNTKEVGNGLSIKAVYGPRQLGYQNAQQAVELAKFALRDFGIDESQITLLRRAGDGYVPSTLAEVNAMEEVVKVLKRNPKKGGSPTALVKAPNDFLIQVEHNYEFNPLDIIKMTELDVKRNWFDRIPMFAGGGGKASVQRYIMDPVSMLHPIITQPMGAATIKAAGVEAKMLAHGKQFSDTMVSLAPDRKQIVWEYMKEANLKGLDFNHNSIVAQGFRPDEVKAIKQWREYWDTVWHLDNKDKAKTLTARGYKYFIDQASGTKLQARPVHNTRVGDHVRVLDETTGKIRDVYRVELSQLYKDGGTVAELERPYQVGSDFVEHVIARNKPNASYMRAINNNDAVLEYRKGYYNVQYIDPKFIDEVVTVNGKTYRKAVATAADSREAELMKARLSASGKIYEVRGNVKGDAVVNTAEGIDPTYSYTRSTQRFRGQRLEEANSNLQSISHQNIMGPVDSMIMSARSVANRVSMRDVIETNKIRFTKQYGHLLQKDRYGRVVFPTDKSQISKRGREYDKDVADARTTYEYISSMEWGYLNTLDDGWKAVLNTLADGAGNISVGKNKVVGGALSKVERGLNAAANFKSPAGIAKNLAYQAYIANNPLRQLILQPHQMIQLLAQNPMYMRQMAKDSSLLVQHRMGIPVSNEMLASAGRTRAEWDSMYKAYERSGLAAQVDKHSLINGSLSELVENSRIKNATNPVAAVTRFNKKIGFNAGEELNMMTSWLSHRDALIREGKYAGNELEDRAISQAANFTYGMNRSADMPYNTGSLGFLFQFMQVPHKALMTMLTNRALTPIQKAKLLGMNALLYSLPTTAMLTWFGNNLPENPEYRDAVVMGLESYTFNKFLSMASGEKTRIDFSGLAPLDMYGTYDFIANLLTSDSGTIIASSPAGSLFFGSNPRLTDAARTMARYVNPTEDWETPTEFGEVLKASASIFSGYSSAFKAIYAFETNKIMSTSGKVIDEQASTFEKMALVFGFPTLDSQESAWVSNEQYRNSKQMKDDVTKWYGDFKRTMARRDVSAKESTFAAQAIGEAWRVFGPDNIVAREMIMKKIEQDVMNGDGTLFQNALKQTGYIGYEDIRTQIESIPEADYSKKQQMLDSIDYIYNHKGE